MNDRNDDFNTTDPRASFPKDNLAKEERHLVETWIGLFGEAALARHSGKPREELIAALWDELSDWVRERLPAVRTDLERMEADGATPARISEARRLLAWFESLA